MDMLKQIETRFGIFVKNIFKEKYVRKSKTL